MPFWPSLGGVETVTELVAEAIGNLGHEVCIATMTRGGAKKGYDVLRTPSFSQLLVAYHKSDGIILMGDSVRLGWPVLAYRKPVLMIHHMFPSFRPGGFLRGLIARRCLHVAPSAALQQVVGFPCQVVPNPYDPNFFFELDELTAKRDVIRIIFVGRMIEEKGVAILLGAAERLMQSGVSFHLTLIGDGPERENLIRHAHERGLVGHVAFLGALSRSQIGEELRGSALAVVPSLCEEAFGLTALEAVACGCAVVVSRSGGLPEAVGECGKVVEKGDSKALANAIEELLSDLDARQRLRIKARSHLNRHLPESVAKSLLHVLTSRSEV